MRDDSFEQLAEHFARNVRETRGKILDDFFKAYIAHLPDDVSLDDICLVEHQCDEPMGINRKYWFEYRPKFED